MGKTNIEWTRGDDGSPGRSWNPVTGCTKVSPGCDHCYAENIARRFAGTKAWPNGFDVTLRPERLDAPLRWRKPCRVFVNSMSDLFHDDVPDEFIGSVFEVMAKTPQHTYQILTKRHGRMRSLLNRWAKEGARHDWAGSGTAVFRRHDLLWVGPIQWPLPNVWIGVSVEDQKRADQRVPILLDTPAAVRWLSCEPLLGPVDLTCGNVRPNFHGPCDGLCDGALLNGIDWAVVGGESGPGHRVMDLDWARSLVEQCRESGTPVFVKQLGTAHGPHKGGDIDTWPTELQVREYPTAVTP